MHLAQEVFVEGVGIAKSVQSNNRLMMQSDVFGTGGSLAIAFGRPAPPLGSERRLCCCGLGFRVSVVSPSILRPEECPFPIFFALDF